MIQRKQGGDELVIGGALTIADGATITGFPKAAGSTVTKAEFKALLGALKAAGLMASE